MIQIRGHLIDKKQRWLVKMIKDTSRFQPIHKLTPPDEDDANQLPINVEEVEDQEAVKATESLIAYHHALQYGHSMALQAYAQKDLFLSEVAYLTLSFESLSAQDYQLAMEGLVQTISKKISELVTKSLEKLKSLTTLIETKIKSFTQRLSTTWKDTKTFVSDHPVMTIFAILGVIATGTALIVGGSRLLTKITSSSGHEQKTTQKEFDQFVHQGKEHLRQTQRQADPKSSDHKPHVHDTTTLKGTSIEALKAFSTAFVMATKAITTAITYPLRLSKGMKLYGRQLIDQGQTDKGLSVYRNGVTLMLLVSFVYSAVVVKLVRKLSLWMNRSKSQSNDISPQDLKIS